eukprot:jgi/Mesen1/8296/ME000450S07509
MFSSIFGAVRAPVDLLAWVLTAPCAAPKISTYHTWPRVEIPGCVASHLEAVGREGEEGGAGSGKERWDWVGCSRQPGGAARGVFERENEEEEEEEGKELVGRFSANAISVTTEALEAYAVGMYPQAGARVNHSCRPNACVSFSKRGVLRLRALEPIGAGQEVCHTYVPLTDMRSVRHSRLRAQYLFDCACVRCSDESPLSIDACLDAVICGADTCCAQLAAAPQAPVVDWQGPAAATPAAAAAAAAGHSGDSAVCEKETSGEHNETVGEPKAQEEEEEEEEGELPQFRCPACGGAVDTHALADKLARCSELEQQAAAEAQAGQPLAAAALMGEAIQAGLTHVHPWNSGVLQLHLCRAKWLQEGGDAGGARDCLAQLTAPYSKVLLLLLPLPGMLLLLVVLLLLLLMLEPCHPELGMHYTELHALSAQAGDREGAERFASEAARVFHITNGPDRCAHSSRDSLISTPRRFCAPNVRQLKRESQCARLAAL